MSELTEAGADRGATNPAAPGWTGTNLTDTDLTDTYLTDTDLTGTDRSDPDRAGRSAADLESGFAEYAQVTPASTPGAPAVTAASIDEIEEALRDVVDPELGVNVVDLGLIYDLNVGDDQVLTIDMTLTSAACPLTDMIEDQVGAALMTPGELLVADYKINWVWIPPWGPEKITDDGREQLRALGFNI